MQHDQTIARSTRTHFQHALNGIGFIASLVLLCGCLERTEHIRIAPNGSVEIVARFESENRDEFNDGDAVPKNGTGWEVSERTVTANDGKKRFQLAARRQFAPGERLPSTFGGPGDTHRKRYLQFPTELSSDFRSGYQYIHFERTYEPRMYAQIMADVEIINARIQKIVTETGDNNGGLPKGRERQIVELYVQSAMARLEGFAREAFRETNQHASPDAWLAAHEALRQLKVNVDYPQLISMVEQVQHEENTQLFQQLEADFESSVIETIQEALRGTGRVRNLSGFLREYESIKDAFHVTEDLGDDSFTIRVTLPGEIVATNADRREGRTLIWRFSGKLVRDRRIELLATSRLRRP